MNRTIKIISADLGQIKQNMDPAFTYLVFERKNIGCPENFFPEITKTLAELYKIEFDMQAYLDVIRNTVWLVLKTVPAAGEILKASFLTINFPKDIIFYVFDSKINS